MWTAVAGAVAQSQNLDMIANNLANSDTFAFKKDLPTFKEYLVSAEKLPGHAGIPHGPIQDKDLLPIDGRDQSFVMMDGAYVNHKQGGIRVTHNSLDLAMDGPGFMEVSTPSGIRYTRDGSLRIGIDGRLVTREGYPVLSQNSAGMSGSLGSSGLGPAARFINLKDAVGPLTINDQGEIFAGGELLSKVSLIEFGHLEGLRKIGGQLFEAAPNAAGDVARQTLVRQGALETSNVNPIEEMTNMIKSNRLFEQDLKALRTYGDLMAKEVNEVGKL